MTVAGAPDEELDACNGFSAIPTKSEGLGYSVVKLILPEESSPGLWHPSLIVGFCEAGYQHLTHSLTKAYIMDSSTNTPLRQNTLVSLAYHSHSEERKVRFSRSEERLQSLPSHRAQRKREEGLRIKTI